MTYFEDSLQKIVASRLKKYSYDYDSNLREGDELFGLRKDLGDDIFAIVQFQRHADLSNDEFTINLLRVKAKKLEPRSFGGYDGALGARLTRMLWYVHQLRIYPASEYWWTSTARSGLEENLIDAVDQIEKYGLAWLEDPNPRKPWEMPEYSADQFVSALNEVVVPDLFRLGYRSETHRLTGDFPYPYFVKSINDQRHLIIEFQQVYSLDPARFDFDVRLQRKATPDPLDFSGDYRCWQSASLGQLGWAANGSAALPDSKEAQQVVLWHYADAAELTDRLQAALEQVKRVAIPWLEQI
jgi:hypothetical protein